MAAKNNASNTTALPLAKNICLLSSDVFFPAALDTDGGELIARAFS
jgi:hypothetical protein